MSEVPGPESEEEQPQWGAPEWRNHWAEGLKLGDIISNEEVIERIESKGIISIESAMRSLDPPDERKVSQLSNEEKRLLLKVAKQWKETAPIDALFIIQKEGKEAIAKKKEKFDLKDLVDIHFVKSKEERVEEKEEFGSFPKEAVFVGKCDRCGTQFKIQAVIVRGGSKGYQIELKDGSILGTFGPEEIKKGVWEWTFPKTVPCQCISKVLLEKDGIRKPVEHYLTWRPSPRDR